MMMILAFAWMVERIQESPNFVTEWFATVSYADLLFQANEVAQKTFRPLEVFTVAALIYFVVIFGASQVAQVFERRLAVSGEGMQR